MCLEIGKSVNWCFTPGQPVRLYRGEMCLEQQQQNLCKQNLFCCYVEYASWLAESEKKHTQRPGDWEGGGGGCAVLGFKIMSTAQGREREVSFLFISFRCSIFWSLAEACWEDQLRLVASVEIQYQ